MVLKLVDLYGFIILLFCAILKIRKAKSSQIGALFYPMFANRGRVNELTTSVVHVSECQFFPSSCSKFDVECD